MAVIGVLALASAGAAMAGPQFGFAEECAEDLPVVLAQGDRAVEVIASLRAHLATTAAKSRLTGR